MSFRYTILPSGNKSEFSQIRTELAKRNVFFQEGKTQSGSTVFAVKEEDLNKLPWDDEHKEFYLPVGFESGHRLSSIKKAKSVQDVVDWLQRK